jgi:hypothetical protein
MTTQAPQIDFEKWKRDPKLSRGGFERSYTAPGWDRPTVEEQLEDLRGRFAALEALIVAASWPKQAEFQQFLRELHASRSAVPAIAVLMLGSGGIGVFLGSMVEFNSRIGVVLLGAVGIVGIVAALLYGYRTRLGRHALIEKALGVFQAHDRASHRSEVDIAAREVTTSGDQTQNTSAEVFIASANRLAIPLVCFGLVAAGVGIVIMPRTEVGFALFFTGAILAYEAYQLATLSRRR